MCHAGDRWKSLSNPLPATTTRPATATATGEEWHNRHDTLGQIIDLITRRNADDSGKEWIESEDTRKILGVSSKTWQNYRDQRLIPFSQIGRKIYVNRADLNAFLRKHRIASRK